MGDDGREGEPSRVTAEELDKRVRAVLRKKWFFVDDQLDEMAQECWVTFMKRSVFDEPKYFKYIERCIFSTVYDFWKSRGAQKREYSYRHRPIHIWLREAGREGEL